MNQSVEGKMRVFDEKVFKVLLAQCNPMPGEYIATEALMDFVNHACLSYAESSSRELRELVEKAQSGFSYIYCCLDGKQAMKNRADEEYNRIRETLALLATPKGEEV